MTVFFIMEFSNLQMILLSSFVNSAGVGTLLQVGKVVVVAAAAAVEEDSTNFLFSVEVKARRVRTTRPGNRTLLKK